MGPLQKENHASVLVDLGTHGVHTVHNAFKDGEVASGWKMKTLMSLLHMIFKKSSSHHADYKNITESNDKEFPILFVSHICVENEPVTKSARKTWSKITEIFKYWKSLPKVKHPGYGKISNDTSYDHLVIYWWPSDSS